MIPIVGKYYIYSSMIVRCKLVSGDEFLAEYSTQLLWQYSNRIEREATIDEICKWNNDMILVLNNRIREYNDLVCKCNSEIKRLRM